MKDMEVWLLAYLVNASWQIPLVFLAAWGAARLAANAGPGLEHRVWAGALMAEALVPACPWSPTDLWLRIEALMALRGGRSGGDVRIVLGPGAGVPGTLQVSMVVLWVLLIAFAVGAAYAACRMAWGLVQTRRMLRGAERLLLQGEREQKWARLQRAFGFGGNAPELAVAQIAGPVTVGVRRRVLLAPRGFLKDIPAGDFEAVVAHEFAHMARHDFAKNLIYGVMVLPVAWHPALWLTRARMVESRERVCDAMAADAVDGREGYARSLLRLAGMLSQAAPAVALQALGIFDSRDFERRIMKLTEKSVEMRGARRAIVIAVCALIGVAACASALALRVGVDDSAANSSVTKPKHIDVKMLKLVHQVPPQYPKQAKVEHVEGKVMLNAIIGKDGSVEHIDVQQSVRGDLDQAAIDAVRQWKYEPVLLNGEPIEVETTINVTYSLKR
ncbi:MAG TPA: M56 family metallopeptidase [Terracidiphilus sp.]|nr:M56 family metallopeptidase [Terracidiphilus sp.]